MPEQSMLFSALPMTAAPRWPGPSESMKLSSIRIQPGSITSSAPFTVTMAAFTTRVVVIDSVQLSLGQSDQCATGNDQHQSDNDPVRALPLTEEDGGEHDNRDDWRAVVDGGNGADLAA